MAQFLPQPKEPGGSWGLAELEEVEESLAVTSERHALNSYHPVMFSVLFFVSFSFLALGGNFFV